MGNDVGIVVDRFLRNVYARPIPGSFVLQVEYTSENPKKAALITNNIIDAYIAQRLEGKFRNTKKIEGWLGKRLEDLSIKLRKANADVEKYKAETNLVSGVRSETTTQQLTELNTQLVGAKAQEAEALAKLEQIQDLIKNPQDIESISETVDSRLIQNLKLEETNILRNISEHSSRYGEQHPEMINARSELSDIRTKLRDEMKIIAQSLQSELVLSKARVEALQTSVNEIEKAKQREDQASVRLSELESEAESIQKIFDAFLEKYNKLRKNEINFYFCHTIKRYLKVFPY